MMSVGNRPWHGLGENLLVPPETAQQAIEAAKLNWKVLQVKVYATDGISWAQIPGRVALVPSDRWGQGDCPVFAEVSESYVPVQNDQAFQFFDPLVDKGLATYETAGALGKGEKIWVLAKLTESIEIAGDRIERYVLLANGHDGNTALQVLFTPVRVVCQNTLSAALTKTGWRSKMYHQVGIHNRMKDLGDDIANVLSFYTELEQQFNAIAAVQLSDERLERYLKSVFPNPEQPQFRKISKERFEKEAQRIEHLRKNCSALFRDGKGNQAAGVAGTLWAAYNGVVEFFDHYETYQNRMARFRELLFGESFRYKSKAFAVAADLAAEWKN